MSSILLKGGTALVHDEKDSVHPILSDILVQGSYITDIGPSLEAPVGCHVVDCTGKIISPGFVDTHHHLWQSPLKGLFGDEAFMPYFATISTCTFTFQSDDMWWANLAGAMEAIDAGITTSLDHSHANWSKDHSKQAIAGTLTSGLRSIFAYTPTFSVKTMKPKVEFADPMPDWFIPVLEKLAATETLTAPDRRVQLGLGFDAWYLPKDQVINLFEKVKSLGVRVITSHYIRARGNDSTRLPAILQDYGQLGRGIVLSHAGGATAEDAQLMKQTGAYVSCTPSSELAMGVGPPVVFRHDLQGIDSVCSFGIDSQGISSSSLVNEMRTGLQYARGIDNTFCHKQGQLPRRIHHTTHEAFNMGTLGGARALCMEDKIGSIAVGKKADLVVFTASSPAMIAAAQQDPVMAVVLHSSIGDVEDVIVDGVMRKRNGKLLPVEEIIKWEERAGEFQQRKTEEPGITWSVVASKVLEIQKRFTDKLPGYDVTAVQDTMVGMFGYKMAAGDEGL